jgi:hypothetical protein
MKNRIARTLALIVLATAFSPLCQAQSSFTCDLYRASAEHSRWVHFSVSSELSSRYEKHLAIALELFEFTLSLSATWH